VVTISDQINEWVNGTMPQLKNITASRTLSGEKVSKYRLVALSFISGVIRKSIYSLWCNLKNCDNIRVQTFLLSDICMLSPLFKSWRTSIF